MNLVATDLQLVEKSRTKAKNFRDPNLTFKMRSRPTKSNQVRTLPRYIIYVNMKIQGQKGAEKPRTNRSVYFLSL